MPKSEKKRQIRYPGICGYAKQFGVTREHLYRVLKGERQSKKLLRRYEEAKKKAA